MDENLYAEERRLKILEILSERKKVSVAELSASLRVSATTIRTDLRDLESGNFLLRTHGGAIEKPQTGFESNLRERAVENRAQKKQIAELALLQIENGDTILLDTGTTLRELARLLHQRTRLTVVTNDLAIVEILEEVPGIVVVVLGGTLRKGFQCTLGTSAQFGATKLTVDKGFFGANGFSLEAGATTPDLGQAEVKQRMLTMVQKVFLLCDHTKIGHACFAQFASVDRIDTLITDSLDSKMRNAFQEIDLVCMEAVPSRNLRD
ncbi:MAG: DeoR/GlpR family DNA-binding transcription regulator [Terrimicrobiaceae bacterium]